MLTYGSVCSGTVPVIKWIGERMINYIGDDKK